MITQLRLQNFKSWEDTGEIQIAPITGFFGTNSSGKSSLLQALLMMKQTVESTNSSAPLDFGGKQNSLVDLGTYRETVFRHDAHRPLGFSVRFEKRSEIDSIDNLLNPDQSSALDDESSTLDKAYQGAETIGFRLLVDLLYRKLSVHEFCYLLNGLQIGMKQRHTGLNGATYETVVSGVNARQPDAGREVPEPVKSYRFPREVKDYFGSIGLSIYLLDELERNLEFAFRRIHYLGPLREYPARYYLWRGDEPGNVGSRGEFTVPALMAAEVEHLHLKAEFPEEEPGPSVTENIGKWLQRLDLVHSFEVVGVPEMESHRIQVRVTENAAPVLLTDVGFGISQALPVLVQCYYVPSGSTLIFEQPELHLHPSVQSDLADLFVEVAKERNLQIIIESHSEHLLRRLQRRIAEEKLDSRDTALYFTSLQEGHSVIERLRLDQYGNILNWPENFFGDEMGDLVAMTEAALYRQN